MRRFKKVLSILLAFVMAAGTIPQEAYASEYENAVVMDDSTATIQGTNGLGKLLSEEMTAYQLEEAENSEGEYQVVDLTIEDNVAVAQYYTVEEAILVVAIYTEDGTQLLESAETEVTPEESIAELTFEGEVPQYFTASAYLVDQYDFSPLCEAYKTLIYTEEMQQILNSTIDDYEADRVLNLDDDETTNFAVCAEDTILLEKTDGKNIVVKEEIDEQIYVIEQADETMQTLQKGDIVVYPYGEEQILIVKVAQINVDGTTVTITGDEDLELSEAFEYMKIEGKGTTKDLIVDENSGDEGVTYQGLEKNEALAEENQARGVFKDDGKDEYTHKFEFQKTVKDDTGSSVSVEGYINVQATFEWAYCLNPFNVYAKMKADSNLAIHVAAEAKVVCSKIELKEFGFAPCAGVYFGFRPEIQPEFQANASWDCTVYTALGVEGSKNDGIKDLSVPPQYNSKLGYSGTVTLNIYLNPYLHIITENAIDVKISGPITIILYGKMTGTNYEHTNITEDTSRHACANCLAGTVSYKTELKGTIEVLKIWSPPEFRLLKKDKTKICDFYYSYDHSEFQMGKCPYKSYRVTVTVKDKNGNLLKNVAVKTTSGISCGTTNKNGVLNYYLPSGNYTLSAVINGKTVSKGISVNDACKVILQESSSSQSSLGGNNSSSQVYSASDDSMDIPVSKMTAIAGSELSESTDTVLGYHEGPAEFILDGDLKTFWHTYYTWSGHSEDVKEEDRWVGVNLSEVMEVGGIRYFPRGEIGAAGNGIVVEYAVQYRTSDTGEWIDIDGATGVWVDPERAEELLNEEDVEWKLVTFEPVAAKQIRLLGIHTGGACGMDRYMSAAEFRVISPTKTTRSTSSYSGREWVSEDRCIVMEEDRKDEIATYGVFQGEYGIEWSEKVMFQTASFENLVPGEQYLFLAALDLEAEEPLAAENLLYVDQAEADETGCLTFRYVPRESAEISYAVVCGASNKDLKDAEITFPEMTAEEEASAVSPTVVYDGTVLQEGQDYVLTGKTEYTEAGTYTCYLRGIHAYTGLVECSYVVKSAEPENPDVTPEQPENPEVTPEQPENPDTEKVERIYGATRYDTSFAIADTYKEELGVSQFKNVIISCGTDFPDALSGGYLADVKQAPILLFNNKPGKSNADAIETYVKENVQSGGTVYLLGGTSAVSDAMQTALLGSYTVKRLGGKTRYETNLAILEEAGVGSKDILICNAQNFADSLSASALKRPILLVNNKKGELTAEQKAFLEKYSANPKYIIGGEAAVSENLVDQIKAYGSVERIWGTTRYETSVEIAKKFFEEPETVVLAYGKNYPDGLCGGVLAAGMNAPLLLTNSDAETLLRDYITEAGVISGIVLGGPILITSQTVQNIFQMGKHSF